MNEELFDQDDANILHLAEHGVTPEEAEEVMLGEPIEVDFEVFDGEDRAVLCRSSERGKHPTGGHHSPRRTHPDCHRI